MTPIRMCAFLMGIFFSIITYASSSGTLVLTGVVPSTFNLTVTPNATASALDITGGEVNKLVAVVNETSNNNAGYKIQFSSANNGLLKNGTIDSVTYQLSYNGGTAVTPTLVAATVKTSNAAAFGVNNNVNITFPAKPNALNGTYTDTVTVTISTVP